MKKLYTRPLVLLVLCLAILPACSRSKSGGGSDRGVRGQRTFSENGLPASNTWTQLEKQCVQRTRAEGGDPRVCFNDIMDPDFPTSGNGRDFVDLDRNGVDDRIDRQNLDRNNRDNNVEGGANSGRGNVGPWAKPCRKRGQQHRDHQRHRPGEKCNICEERCVETCKANCTTNCQEESCAAEDCCDTTANNCSTKNGCSDQKTIRVEVSSQPTPSNYIPPVATQPTPVQQPYIPAPQPYVPAPQPYKPAPVAQQPYVPAPQPYKPVPQPVVPPGLPPQPALPTPVAQPPITVLPPTPVAAGPSQPNIPSKGGAPAQPPAVVQPPTGNGMGICGGANSSSDGRMLLQLAVFKNQNTRAGDPLLQAGEAAFPYITNFDSAKREVKAATYINGHEADYTMGTASITIIPVELAETLALKLLPLETRPCDINDTGECIIIEKNSRERDAKVSVYALASDHTNEQPLNRHRINTIKYYRQNVNNSAVLAAAEKALANDPDGFYLFSRAEVKNPVRVICGNRNLLADQTQVSTLPPQPATVYPVEGANANPAPAMQHTLVQGYPNSKIDSVVNNDVANNQTAAAAPSQQAQYEAEYQGLMQQQQAIYEERIEANCTKRASEDRIHGAPAGWLAKPVSERTPCDRDQLQNYRQQQYDQISRQKRGGVIYTCAVIINYDHGNPGYIGLQFNKEIEGKGKIYCKPSNGAPVVAQEITAKHNRKIAAGIKVNMTNNTLIATGIGWANGPDGLIDLRNYSYLVQANAAVPFLGGVGVTPIIFGNNSVNGEGPVLALAVTWIKPFTFSLQAELNFFGSWVIDSEG